MRATSVPFSPARPSRLKNEPGIFPAAYIRSSTSTVSGRKSTSRWLPAVAVDRTTVSPARTVTAPLACLASLPVSNEISVPPISTETRVTSDNVVLSSPPVLAGVLCVSDASVVAATMVAVHPADVRLSHPAPRAAPWRRARRGLPLLRRRRQPRGDHATVAGLRDHDAPPDRHARRHDHRVPAPAARPSHPLADADRGLGAGRALRGPPAARPVRAVASHARVRGGQRRRHGHARHRPLRAAVRPGGSGGARR